MTTVTATDLARRTNQVLDALARGESVTITRNNTVLGTISPPARAVTLREAFERLPKISRDAAERYKADIRDAGFDDEVRDPWQH
jgi:antitoxin (DNA-binding transcriptional repressor) of toxin-antitoxin stability system